MRRVGVMLGWLVAGCIPSIDAPSPSAAAPLPDPPPVQTSYRPAADPEPLPPPRPSIPTEAERRRSTRRPPVRRESAPLPTPVRTDASEVVTAPATARPAWEARPVAPDATEVQPSTYLVQRGDTLQAIADRTGAGLDAIARANAISAPYPVRAGQRLTIPGGRFHLVRPGQSGIAIARAYGVPWSRIVAENALAEPYVLRAGQRILLPGTPASPASRAAERAAAFTLDIDTILTGGEPALASNQAPARPAATPARVLPSTAAVVPPARLAGGGFLWPVDGRVIQRFGPGRSGERNDGINIAAALRTPIRATADGVVAYAGTAIAALGGLVIIKHGGGWTSIYGYAARIDVQRGQAVKRGQVIALSGETGSTDRPAVHFELRRGRTPVDPQSQLGRT